METKPKVYIAGKFNDNPLYPLHFKEAEIALWKKGYFPINPAEIVPCNWPREMAMKLCTPLIDMADAVLMLSDWENSEGAKLERDYALSVSKRLYYSINQMKDRTD